MTTVTGTLDPGIAALVTFLRDRGVPTTDSGDGVTKADLIATGDALDVPHVHAISFPGLLIDDANKLAALVAQYVEETRDERFARAEVTATYCVGDGVCTVSVIGEP